MRYREKRIYAGDYLEIETYPVYDTGRRVPGRRGETREAQKKLNEKNAKKHLKRMINTNFTKEDVVLHATFRDDEMPETEEEVRKVFQNYLRRVKRYRQKNGMTELKYIYVIECKVSARTGVARWHIHAILSGMDRDLAEKMWGHGEWTNCDRLQPGEKGCEALAKYLCKDPKGAKRWSGSKNLKKPIIQIKEPKRMTKRKADQIGRCYDNSYYEKTFKGYILTDCQSIFNDVNGQWYIYAQMRKK